MTMSPHSDMLPLSGSGHSDSDAISGAPVTRGLRKRHTPRWTEADWEQAYRETYPHAFLPTMTLEEFLRLEPAVEWAAIPPVLQG